MFCDTDALAGQVRAAETRNALPHSLCVWAERGSFRKMRPCSWDGIRPREQYLWLSRALQVKGCFRAMIPSTWIKGAPPSSDRMRRVDTFRQWAAEMRLLRKVPVPGWAEGVHEFRLSTWPGAQEGEDPVAEFCRPDGSTGSVTFMRLKKDRDLHIQHAALLGEILVSSAIGAELPPNNPARGPLSDACSGLLLGSWEYWCDFLDPIERGLKDLIPRVKEAGLILRDPFEDQPVSSWAELEALQTGGLRDSPLLQMMFVQDFLCCNLPVLLDFIHQESGKAPLTEEQQDEVWRCALLGWTEHRGPPPMYDWVKYSQDEDRTASAYQEEQRSFRQGRRWP